MTARPPPSSQASHAGGAGASSAPTASVRRPASRPPSPPTIHVNGEENSVHNSFYLPAWDLPVLEQR